MWCAFPWVGAQSSVNVGAGQAELQAAAADERRAAYPRRAAQNLTARRVGCTARSHIPLVVVWAFSVRPPSEPGARVDGAGADSRQPGDHPEDLVSLSPPQGPPGDGHEEPAGPRGGAEPVPRGGVGTEGSGDRRVQGDKAYPAGASRDGR